MGLWIDRVMFVKTDLWWLSSDLCQVPLRYVQCPLKTSIIFCVSSASNSSLPSRKRVLQVMIATRLEYFL